MNFKYFISVICFCLTLALIVPSAQAVDSGNLKSQGLSHYIIGVYSDDLGDLDRAIAEYQLALKFDPDSSLLHLKLASVFIQKDDLASAIEHLKSSIGLDPLSVEPHVTLAILYSAQNKEDLAVQEYSVALKNAVRFQPKNIEIYKSLGAIYLQQKKLKEAEGIFKLIIGLSPKDPEAHFYLSSIYFDLKDYLSVEKELKTALKLKPDYPEALNFLGYFYLLQDKNINQAGALIKKALKFEPSNGAYIDSLGWYYFKKGKFKEALIELEKAASLLSDPEIYDHLGEVFLKLGNKPEAKINWEKSLKLNPAQDKIKEKLQKLTNNGK
ncbi:MAG: tetratricopeptide repeat protein [Candidatus Omnitrophica bacterium]|jgi:tetratricopeptide (TPR) repeat protein|nr:tetratricopeptide repeat protein [Candidatus Omnitrophota bacterium]MDD5660639.1 tetratricopeptide repeat protein [Candidatus Omnitrophota bacterium]